MMRIDQFDFHLPAELIAERPARPRSSARMLYAQEDVFSDKHVYNLPSILKRGDLLVFNNTKVIPAHLVAQRWRGSDQARISITLLEAEPDGSWRAFLKPLRKVREGEELFIAENFSAQVEGKTKTEVRLRFNLRKDAFDQALNEFGQMPLPPYIAAKRAIDTADQKDYQTVFAKTPGAVAAPTAALHFDEALLNACTAAGIKHTYLTLHVGAGTFLPVKVENLNDHKMHAEWGEITETAAEEINHAHAEGRRVIAVGTTALRLMETAADKNGKMAAWTGKTDIFIKPGTPIKSADALMTNFHLPKSTLMVLVAAFIGQARTKALYAHAVSQKYRFYSYGDSSLLIGAELPRAKQK